MKTLTLSDHTAEVLQQQQDQRTAFVAARWKQYTDLVAARQLRLSRTAHDLRSAWNGQGFSFRLVGPLCRWLAARMSGKPKAPGPIYFSPTQQERQWSAGNEGENFVYNHLAHQLGDDWTVIKGYRNPRGEIDFIAVGPVGIIAIEVKYLNGCVSCNRDTWWIDKYDNYGNVVESARMLQDRGGRSPARQVNEAANELQVFLFKQGVQRRIMRLVVLAHPKSWVGDCQGLTIDGVYRTDHLFLPGLQNPAGPISSAEADKVIAFIQRDHKHHNERRQQRKPVRVGTA